MPTVVIIGGGLAGLSAAAALGASGYKVDLLEARNSWAAARRHGLLFRLMDRLAKKKPR